MAGEGARPGEQAHLRGGYREQAHDGGLGGPVQGAVAVTEGSMATPGRQSCHAAPVGAERLWSLVLAEGFWWELVTP